MNPFAYVQADDVRHALALIAEPGPAGDAAQLPRFIAGGTNVLDLMKENVLRPARLVDLRRLPLHGIEALPDGSLRLGALARNADTAYDVRVRTRLPLLSSAILAGASPQIRNMASNGGNLLQRTRCVYFYDTATPCNKRTPGAGCAAIGGLARQHAVLGASAACIATHPSDMCVALAALDAQVQLRSLRGARTVPLVDFHRLPHDRPERDTVLADDELVEAIVVPPARQYADHAVYLKLRERQSYAFALVSVAAALDLAPDGRIRSARLALGGVAHKPWRRPVVEALLAGQRPDTALFEAVAARLLEGARPQGAGPGCNAFKIPMARRAIVRALGQAVRGTVTNTADNTA